MNKTVKVYSTSSCPYCIRLKQFLKEKNITFENIDIASDNEKKEEMIKISGQMGVPVVVIDGDVTVGFEKEKISKALDIQ